MRVKFAASLVVVTAFVLSAVPSSRAWGEEGHRYVNQVAAESMPSDMPSFFRDATKRLSFLGYEPDRWRDNKELYSALKELNAPDHFIDIDDPKEFAALPNDRYRYADWLRSRGKEPKEIGFLPYSILEGYQKMQVLFRMWRDNRNASERDQIEQNIIFYAGVMGHYVADGAQPLHTTVHYNGWSTSSNPDLYTREPLHWRFEGEYVKAQIKPEDFRSLVKPAEKLKDPFSDIMKFLFESFGKVEDLYRMEKVARWDERNTSAESKRFVANRLASGAQMLANLWYTAWIDSANGLSSSQ